MKYFMDYIAKICIAFTFSSMFVLLFSNLTIFPPFDGKMIINMLYISIAITSLIYITHLLPFQNAFIFRLLEIFSIIFILLISGSIFGMFPLLSLYIFLVIVIGLLTYIIVIVVTFVGNKTSEKKINSVIANNNRRKSNEENN